MCLYETLTCLMKTERLNAYITNWFKLDNPRSLNQVAEAEKSGLDRLLKQEKKEVKTSRGNKNMQITCVTKKNEDIRIFSKICI